MLIKINKQRHCFNKYKINKNNNMAFSLRAGTNWCHDFPKLARESGFYFNMHRSKVRVDWNRISTIDIDSVIRDRDFLTIDENVNNVVDYSLENEYDVKILDPNFVKLFRLSQLAVEYLLYCKQYLDHSVIILKDELRLKLEENGKLKKDLLTAEENIQELKDKFKDKQKYIEAKFSDSHGEIHKCPQCPKTFISSVFMNSHLSRRHSNVTISSPEHEQYRAEAEKLNNEIKNLKERLNETERLVRNDTIKKFENNDLSNDIKNSLSIDRSIYQEKKIEDEHRRYREEISNLKSMLFNELRNLKSSDNDKKILENDDSFGNTWKEQIRQQENEIKILKDNIQIRTNQDIENIKLKLNSQEEFWLTKINDINKQHKFDIDKLYKQLKINEQSWDCMKNDYLKKINDLEEMYKAELSKNDNIDIKNSHDNRNIPLNSEKVLSIRDNKRSIMIDPIESENPRDSFIQKRDKKLSSNSIELDDNYQDKKSPSLEIKFDQWQDQSEIISSEKKTRIPEPAQQVFVKKSSALMTKKFEESLSDSDDSNTQSETMTTSKMSSDESDEISESLDDSDDENEDHNNDDKDKNNKSTIHKNKEQLKLEAKDNIEQHLRDLGVDPDWQGLPYKTYCQLSKIIKHHRTIKKKKYTNFDDIRNEIINDVNKKLMNKVVDDDDDNNNNETSNKKLQLNKLLKNVKTKAFRAFNMNDNSTNDTIKQKRIIVNKHNIDILPKKIKSPIVSSPELSTKPRYTSSPCKKSFKTVETSVDVKQFSHSYESIKDYLKDPMEKTFYDTQNIDETKSSKDGLLSLPTSPKNNRGVLKTTTGSVGSLVKKKVEFVLDNDEKSMNDSSKDEFHISSISEEKSDDIKAIDPKKNNDIILKTTQSDKIYEIAKKLETQLNITRQKPVGAVEAMFMKKLHFTNDDLSINNQNNHYNYPMPAPRLSKSSINQSEKNEMTNLDLDIEELLAME